MKKILSMILSAAMLFSVACGASAVESSHTEAPLTVPLEGEPGPSLRDVNHIPDHDVFLEAGTDSFFADFTCEPSEGNKLNIWMQNNGTSTLIVTVTWNGEAYEPQTITPGNRFYQNYYYEDGSGLGGDWTVVVTTESGGDIDMRIAARQFQG